MKITKKYCQNKQKINIENYLKKKKIKKNVRNRYQNISKENKQILKEYQKKLL